jgi:hypothetical protein
MSGKTTFKSVFTFSSKDSQIKNLELTIENLQHEIESLQALTEYVTLIVGGIEIHRFKVKGF